MSCASVRVDRDRFLALVMALAAPACGKAAATGDAPLVVVATVEPASPDAGGPIAALPSEPAERDPRPAADACEQQNDTGLVDCSWVHARRFGGPTCEGMAGTCDALAEGSAYRPRAARAIAECFQQLGRRYCDIRARKKCYEEGVRAACPEEKFEAKCEDRMEACRAASVRITYTKEECVKVLSALRGGDRDWALSAMGPSSEGKCRLMYTVM